MNEKYKNTEQKKRLIKKLIIYMQQKLKYKVKGMQKMNAWAAN